MASQPICSERPTRTCGVIVWSDCFKTFRRNWRGIKGEARTLEILMADHLLAYPLTPKTVHLCVDMQRIFSEDGPWPTPWMGRVLPVIKQIVHRHPERALFPASLRLSIPARCQ